MQNPAAGTYTVNFMKRIIPATVILFLLIHPVSHAETMTDIPVGKIEFISSARCEAIIYASSDSGLAAASTGSVLYAVTGNKRTTLTVTGTEGRFIRCAFECGGTGKPALTEGNGVFFAESDNRTSGYADVKVMMHRMLKSYREFILAVESTEDPVVIAAALNRLSDSIEILIPEITRLNARYPELNNFTDSPPEGLKADVELLNRTGPLVSDAFLKISKLPPHKSVDEALKRLKTVLEKMENIGK